MINDKVKTSQTGTSGRSITFRAEVFEEDYYKVTLAALRSMANNLAGGQYKPLSDRDARLSVKLHKFVAKQERKEATDELRRV